MEEYAASGKSLSSSSALVESISDYEASIGKDVAEMSFDEAKKAMSTANVGTYTSAATVALFVKKYVKWCNQNKVFDSVNLRLLDLTISDVDASVTLKRQLFISEEDLIKEMRRVRQFDDGYYEVIVLILAWLGVDRKDILTIKIDDVNFDSNEIMFRKDNRVIQMSKNIKDILYVFSRTKIGTRASNPRPREVYRDDSFDSFVRKFCPKEQLGLELTESQIIFATNRMNQAYVDLGNEPKFTHSNVAKSGALRRLYELEQSGVDVFSIRNKQIVKETFVIDDNLNRILWLYKNYKVAFNL